MNREQLKGILPHREPMLLVDEAEIVSGEEGLAAKGRYTVRGDEFFLQGHFPGNPVVPGVIQCEMMAQTCGVLMSAIPGAAGKTPLYTGLNKVKFKRQVRPGDTIEFFCRLTAQKNIFCFAEGKGTVEGEVCVQGEFSFALV
ncbi:MAG: 3-hydroxyacyl-ACP dehydratase FabZ [Oscillospiraceae bacterium]|nr:3-hydroxyacyl-ACP dehydratase FabZ [Oscillospiraceae bacterium]